MPTIRTLVDGITASSMSSATTSGGGIPRRPNRSFAHGTASDPGSLGPRRRATGARPQTSVAERPGIRPELGSSPRQGGSGHGTPRRPPRPARPSETHGETAFQAHPDGPGSASRCHRIPRSCHPPFSLGQTNPSSPFDTPNGDVLVESSNPHRRRHDVRRPGRCAALGWHAVDAYEDRLADQAEAEEQLEDAEREYERAVEKAEKDRLRALRKAQWFLSGTGHPRWSQTADKWYLHVEPEYTEWVVAVLDTGVAYQDAGEHVRAPTLAASSIVAPWDFVNDDAGADDDHQHGTHIASLIASKGDVQGVAPGATLMPVKVLDADNTGVEIDLINGIHHAVDNGAHVINMSLSFREGYVPSLPLLEALQRASDAGIVLVAAAGNSGADRVTWPAAYREVIAVASAAIDGKHGKHGKVIKAEYSNSSALVDLTAPGGQNGADRNEDGVIDGVLGETISLNQPGELGYWFYAGTSQAAAITSGAAVHMLEAGATPDQVKAALQYDATENMGDPYEDGGGAGSIDIEDAIESVEDQDVKIVESHEYHAAIMPYFTMEDGGKNIRPRARISVVGIDGAPVNGVTAYGEIIGDLAQPFTCTTDPKGVCKVMLDKISVEEDDVYTDPALSMLWQLDTVARNDIADHPYAVLFATDGFELLHAGAEANASTAGGLLALRFGAVDDDTLGDLHESFLVVNAGTGLATSPMGLAFTPGALAGIATVTQVSVDIDGTGLATSPMGFAPMWTLAFDGTGLATSPMGLLANGPLVFTAFDGTGLATSPMGFSALHMFLPGQNFDGTGLATSPMGFSSNPIFLQSGTLMGTGLETSSLASTVGAGGWVTPMGYPGASVMVASGLVSTIAGTSGEAAVQGASTSLEGVVLSDAALDAAITQMLVDEGAAAATTDPAP